MDASGYLHPDYARSFTEIGEPVLLEYSGGSLIKRQIQETTYHDAMGCYPLFSCAGWEGLEQDLAGIDEGLVSVTVVTDPFGEYDEDLLSRCFPELVKPYKEHQVADLSQPLKRIVSEHHRRNARKALEECDVMRCGDPGEYLDDWNDLYANLISRHDIQGVATFSRQAFEAQFRTPGLVAFRAFSDSQTLGMLLWFVQGGIAYYHLGAYRDAGYDKKASFALFWQSFEYFADMGLKWVNMGAGAGIFGDNQDGLTRFKKGWATDTRTAYLCGRVCNRDAYDALSKSFKAGFFPAYRSNL